MLSNEKANSKILKLPEIPEDPKPYPDTPVRASGSRKSSSDLTVTWVFQHFLNTSVRAFCAEL